MVAFLNCEMRRKDTSLRDKNIAHEKEKMMRTYHLHLGFFTGLFLAIPNIVYAQSGTPMNAKTHTNIITPAPAAINGSTMSLEQVLRHVYENNPTIQASRYGLKATHELYPQAKAGWHPTINAEAGVNIADIETRPTSRGDGVTTKNISLNAEQPIFRGGRTHHDMERANYRIKAGYKRMLQTEQDVFLRAISLYMDVIRDRMKVGFQKNSYEVLREEKNSLNARFQAGDVTTTDVKRAEARAADSLAQSIRAEGDLKGSEAAFEEVVGFAPPVQMEMPQPDFRFPVNAPALMLTARENNPELFAAKFDYMAAQNDIGIAESDLYPQVSAFASYIKEYDPQPGVLNESSAGTIGLRMRVNLYEGGKNMSRIREAKNRANQRRILIQETERAIQSDLVESWNQLNAYKTEVESRKLAVASADLSRLGVKEEARLGERTNVETLDAERDMLSTQIALVEAQRDMMVTEYRLAAALGLLLPEHMGMADIAYDPGPHYRAVAGRIFSADEGDPAKIND
jgi:outer membrane protein